MDFTLNEFKQAMLCISSRLFTTHLTTTGQRIEALVPLADMANHSEDPDVMFSFCPRRQGFVYTAVKDVTQGAAISTSYCLNNAESTFRTYGFLPDKMDDLSLGMPLARALPADDPLLELKAEIFRDARLRTYDL